MAKQRDGSTPTPSGNAETHRWAIDRVEEGTAAVEQDGGPMYEIPRWLIPATARDGDVLVATLTTGTDGATSVTVRIDPTAKPPAPPKIPKGGKDRGGDIAL